MAGADDTIYALATAAPTRLAGAGIAVIRVSGKRAGDAYVFLTEPGAFQRGFSARDPSLPTPRKVMVKAILDPGSGEVIDRGLALWFQAPNSYTGETMAEFHIHGGRAVIAAALGALAQLDFCRLAEPGEFTRRAFENNKLDLTSAEAIADLVAAETTAQRRQALRQYDGALFRLYDGWRDTLLRAVAHLEASIDFPDEGLPANVVAKVWPDIERLRDEIGEHLNDRRGERLRDGVTIAIIGPPNAGKSSLLNLIAKRDAAIVASTAGTTRDVIEVHLDLGGYPVTIADTAGLRASSDPVEQEGVRRAKARASDADIRILVVEAAGDWQHTARDIWTTADVWNGATDLIVVNKTDLLPDKGGDIDQASGDDAVYVGVSALSGDGVPQLLERLEGAVAAMLGDVEAVGETTTLLARAADTPPPLTRARHREALTHCAEALERAMEAARTDPDLPELIAEDVRLATRALARITGRMDVEDLLDVVFRDFCIGK
ncbi:MAG: tRNA uridine-5-carboxymethylaminomethyl(34) synthesis GTPase MnmE [Alphaproteobacteria bacterium]|nr:tRNA uridine-5-carboxymethylaminomethyl(34) synthesis GTPase MnmE [Alphaproteobacteria bacterium]